ncbi:hypothetical protein STAS_19519 [Striga asiatica]|uniref:Uncharacterized protein n=1 Tax=Striga asiatica TaxID=4170 RepID=A0A5A7QCA9_STRAF|nr:hypothetical protein STAS_19519 [Striga asiatica]
MPPEHLRKIHWRLNRLCSAGPWRRRITHTHSEKGRGEKGKLVQRKGRERKEMRKRGEKIVEGESLVRILRDHAKSAVEGRLRDSNLRRGHNQGHRRLMFTIKVEEERNQTAELAVSTGCALALNVLINKAFIFRVRVLITLALTHLGARFLVWRNHFKMSV